MMRPILWALLILIVTGSALSAAPVHAQDEDAPILSVQVENDLFATDTDRHYTNGIRISYLTRAKPCDPDPDVPCLSGFLRRLTSFIPAFRHGEEHRIAYSVGQNMYTPSDITNPNPIPDDQPYAGWLYAGLGFVSKITLKHSARHEFIRLDRLELNIGVVGPLSGAEATQKIWHGLFGFRKPQGWGNQLRNEPGLVLTYERQWLFKEKKLLFNDLDVEVAPELGAAVGNIYTYASAGMRLRVGTDLPADYGPPRIRPSLPGSAHFVAGDRVSAYLFGAVEGRAVARNIFLDGNTFTSSLSVRKKHFVGDLQIGAAMVVPRTRVLPPFRLSYTYIWRSREFYGQDFGDRFGSISMSFNL